MTATSDSFVLAERTEPIPAASGLDRPYWESTREGRLVIQRCTACDTWRWGPEWICHVCRSFDTDWVEVPKRGGRYAGRIYSWERVWHPTSTALVDRVPYVILLVELPDVGGVRMVGNLVGDATQTITIGAEVEAVFEHHENYTLVQWRLT